MTREKFNAILNNDLTGVSDEDLLHYKIVNTLMNDYPLSFEESLDTSKKLVSNLLSAGVIRYE